MVGLHPHVDRVVDGLRLPVAAASADHEVVRVGDDSSEIELDDVRRLAIRRVRGDRDRDLLGCHPSVLPPYRRCSRMYPATASGTMYLIGLPSRTRSRISVDETPIVGIAKKVARSPPDSALSAT